MRFLKSRRNFERARFGTFLVTVVMFVTDVASWIYSLCDLWFYDEVPRTWALGAARLDVSGLTRS